MTVGFLMVILAIIAVLFQAMLIHLLNKKIPSQYTQREEGERIINQRSFKNINEVKLEFEHYFSRVRIIINQTIGIYAVLTVIIFLLFQGFLYAIPLPPPRPGPFVVQKYVVSAFFTLIVTSFGWVRILLERSQLYLLAQEIMSKYIILGIFEPGN